MYYQKHVFICTNQREAGKQCCANSGAVTLLNYAKAKIKTLQQNGRGKVRINGASCMDRCAEGPVLVIYPDGVWYRYQNQSDIDEIIEKHVIGGNLVDRLLLE